MRLCCRQAVEFIKALINDDDQIRNSEKPINQMFNYTPHQDVFTLPTITHDNPRRNQEETKKKPRRNQEETTRPQITQWGPKMVYVKATIPEKSR